MMRKAINIFLVIICAVAIFNIPLFFTFMGLLGIEYQGAESSNLYVYYIFLVSFLSFFSYLYSVLTRGVLKKESIIILIVLFFLFLHVLWVIFDTGYSLLFPKFLLLFFLLGLPGFFAAATIIKLNLMFQLIRFVEIAVIIMALGIAAFSVLPTFTGVKIANIAGASYQSLSYYSAFTFGLLLIYNIYLPKSFRTFLSSFLWYRGLSYVLILTSMLGCFIGGGRGAFLLLISYLVLIFLSTIMNGDKALTRKEIIRTLLRLLIIFFIILVFFIYFWEREFVQTGFIRATQFFSVGGGIDLESGSSGRNFVYQYAINFISEKPLVGYGPFGYIDKTLQAHNFFLEILLQFGVIGFIVFLTLLGALVVNSIRNWSIYSYWVFGLLLYPLIMIMFSGTYMHSAVFIFGVSFMTMYKKDRL